MTDLCFGMYLCTYGTYCVIYCGAVVTKSYSIDQWPQDKAMLPGSMARMTLVHESAQD